MKQAIITHRGKNRKLEMEEQQSIAKIFYIKTRALFYLNHNHTLANLKITNFV